MSGERAIVPIGQIEQRILLIRGQRVMLDADLAKLYGVETRVLNQAVRRNPDRFPEDFMFRLTEAETKSLRSQFVISNTGRGGRRYAPYAFTEHGAIMAASVLNSPRAVKVSVYVVRAFVKLREVLSTHKALARKLAELERRLDTHDDQIEALLEAIRELMVPPPEPRRRRIGFAQGG
jgi:hypothetical protein